MIDYSYLIQKVMDWADERKISASENLTKQALKLGEEYGELIEAVLINISRKSRDFSHGMDRPLLSPFMGLFVCFCIFLVIDIFLDNFFAHIAQCTHIVTRRPKMTAPILATSYFWMIL